MDNAQEVQKDKTGFSFSYSFTEMTEEAQQQLKDAAAAICKDISNHLDLAPLFQTYKDFPTTEIAAQIVLADAIDVLTQNANLEQLFAVTRADTSEEKVFSILEDLARKADKAAFVDAYKAIILCAGRETLTDRIYTDFLKAFIEETQGSMREIDSLIKQVEKLPSNDTYKKIQTGFAQILFTFREFQKWADYSLSLSLDKETRDFLLDTDIPQYSLLYYISLEMDESTDPDISGTTLAELVKQGIAENREPAKNKYGEVIERARKRQAADAAAQEEITEPAKDSFPRVVSQIAEKVLFPLDKPNRIIWDMIAAADPSGQIKMQIDTSRKGSGQDAYILYGIDFSALETNVKITKALTQFDKRCYIAAAALYNAGNTIITATQIYYAMGNTTRPNKEDLQKVNDSMTKMGAAHVFVDNIKEVQATKKNQHFKYDAALLPFERITAVINGQQTESAMHLFREPPLITFARQRNQITTLTRQLLESPISKTEANLRLDDYLLERIGHMKNRKGNTPRKILFTTIYNNCNVTGKAIKRTPDKIRRYLDHYQKCGWIKGYTEDTDGVTILL